MNRRSLRVLLVLLLLPLLAVPLAGYWLFSHLERPLHLREDAVLEVDSGQSFSGMIRYMGEQGWLGEGGEQDRRRLATRLYLLDSDLDRRLHAGEYHVRPGDSLATVLERLERGEVIQHRFTIVEGWTFRQLRERLAAHPKLASTVEDDTDEEIMERLERAERHPEGWFSPNTYHFTRGTTDLDLLRRALARQERILEEAWEQREAGLPLEDAYEALILASIVERETGVPEERGRIAGVFVRRLERNMRLQTDPTVIYGMGEDYDGRIRTRDLRRHTPWNTYVIHGLPPTPIAMPGKEAIQATVRPERTEALFFVARGDGTHHFSATLEEHEEAVRRYQLDRREDYRSTPLPLPEEQ